VSYIEQFNRWTCWTDIRIPLCIRRESVLPLRGTYISYWSRNHMNSVLHLLYWHCTGCQFDIAIPCQILVGGLWQHPSGIDKPCCSTSTISECCIKHVALFKYQLCSPPPPTCIHYDLWYRIAVNFIPLSLVQRNVWSPPPQCFAPCVRSGRCPWI
jgi:hypothetical protein